MGDSFTRSRTGGNSGNRTASNTGYYNNYNKERSSRIHSLTYPHTEYDSETLGYALDEHPDNKVWSETRCESEPDQQHARNAPVREQSDDATTTRLDESVTWPLPDSGQRSGSEESAGNTILKMNAFTVTTEQRVV
jgi:hypothetical protein